MRRLGALLLAALLLASAVAPRAAAQEDGLSRVYSLLSQYRKITSDTQKYLHELGNHLASLGMYAQHESRYVVEFFDRLMAEVGTLSAAEQSDGGVLRAVADAVRDQMVAEYGDEVLREVTDDVIDDIVEHIAGIYVTLNRGTAAEKDFTRVAYDTLNEVARSVKSRALKQLIVDEMMSRAISVRMTRRSVARILETPIGRRIVGVLKCGKKLLKWVTGLPEFLEAMGPILFIYSILEHARESAGNPQILLGGVGPIQLIFIYDDPYKGWVHVWDGIQFYDLLQVVPGNESAGTAMVGDTPVYGVFDGSIGTIRVVLRTWNVTEVEEDGYAWVRSTTYEERYVLTFWAHTDSQGRLAVEKIDERHETVAVESKVLPWDDPDDPPPPPPPSEPVSKKRCKVVVRVITGKGSVYAVGGGAAGQAFYVTCGSFVAAYAKPAEGYRFKKWSVSVSATGEWFERPPPPVIGVIVNKSTTYIDAFFEAIPDYAEIRVRAEDIYGAPVYVGMSGTIQGKSFSDELRIMRKFSTKKGAYLTFNITAPETAEMVGVPVVWYGRYWLHTTVSRTSSGNCVYGTWDVGSYTPIMGQYYMIIQARGEATTVSANRKDLFTGNTYEVTYVELPDVGDGKWRVAYALTKFPSIGCYACRTSECDGKAKCRDINVGKTICMDKSLCEYRGGYVCHRYCPRQVPYFAYYSCGWEKSELYLAVAKPVDYVFRWWELRDKSGKVVGTWLLPNAYLPDGVFTVASGRYDLVAVYGPPNVTLTVQLVWDDNGAEHPLSGVEVVVNGTAYVTDSSGEVRVQVSTLSHFLVEAPDWLMVDGVNYTAGKWVVLDGKLRFARPGGLYNGTMLLWLADDSTVKLVYEPPEEGAGGSTSSSAAATPVTQGEVLAVLAASLAAALVAARRLRLL